jgi:hypothetical protein
MKKLSVVLTQFLFVISGTCFAQVNEIGHFFDKTGFIQEINHEQKYLIVNFPTVEEISEEQVFLIDPKTNTQANGINELNNLRLGMEVQIEGDKYPQKGITVAKSIKIKPIVKKVKIDKGRLDDVTKDYAVVDGSKVWLKPGEKIIGEKKSLYRNKTFTSFSELKLGDFVNLEGVWDEKGSIVASDVETFPDLETMTDREKRFTGKQTFHNVYVNDWLDPVKRTKLLGADYNGSKILNSNSLQNYIQNLGMKLLPAYIQNKIKFMFMVVDNSDWNAFAQPDGLVIVNTGLLVTMDNEAQLAAVLGHEITHAIYEHSANKADNRKELTKANTESQAITNTSSALAKSFINWAKLPPVTYSVVSKYKLKQNVDSVARALTSLQKAKRDYNESVYSKDAEAQSDRVGLYWMSKAGYDPREAMKVWRAQYNQYYHFETQNTGEVVSEVTSFSKEFNRYQRPPSLADIGVSFFKSRLKNKTADLANQAYSKDGSLNTHPDDLKRFAALNKHTFMFFQSTDARKLGREELAKALDDANADMEKAARALAEKNAREYAKRVALDKAYEKAKAKIKSQLIGHETVLLNYKDYKLTKCLKLKELTGKSKCDVPKIEGYVNDLFDQYNTETNTFVSEFKAGSVGPNKRNSLFTVHYSTAKSFNDFMVEIAARYVACDTEMLNAIRATIERNEIKRFIAPSQSEMLNMLQYLESLENKK